MRIEVLYNAYSDVEALMQANAPECVEDDGKLLDKWVGEAVAKYELDDEEREELTEWLDDVDLS